MFTTTKNSVVFMGIFIEHLYFNLIFLRLDCVFSECCFKAVFPNLFQPVPLLVTNFCVNAPSPAN